MQKISLRQGYGRQTCSNSWCRQSFEVTDEDLRLYKSFDVEPITECFHCVQKHHLSFRNGRMLYHRRCDLTGEDILSNIAPEKPFKVYKREAWYGDRWDALSFGRAFDFGRSFFDQFRELQLDVPRIALFNVNSENSEYCNMTAGNKNCYLVFGGDFNQDVLYGTLNMRNRNAVDCDFSNENELCYDVFNSFSCYECRFTYDSKNCTDCAFVSDCIGCSDCILCTNLKNQSHCIENQKLSKEEYAKRRGEFFNGSFAKQEKNRRRLLQLRSERVVKAAHAINCENCTGDYLENSKGCVNCYLTWKSEDCRHCFVLDACKSSLRTDFTRGELCFHVQSGIDAQFCSYSYSAATSSEAIYCDSIVNCQSVFGCVGLNRKQYCILNKQYAKKEYENFVTKIVNHMKKTGEWGKFFPKEFSCFAYNESTAQEFFPLSKE